jgi:hypothetical protein
VLTDDEAEEIRQKPAGCPSLVRHDAGAATTIPSGSSPRIDRQPPVQ